MLGTRSGSGSRHSSPSDSVTWQEFARYEGRKSAEDFLDRLKEFKERNEDIPESMCVREYATSLTESLAGLLDRCNSPSRPSLKPDKPKQWWKIFKRRSSTVRRKSASSRDASSSYENTRQIILDRTVMQMNLQDGNVGEWIKCRIVLVGFQDNYHIEVYCPPKTVIPKMTLFCFLIEEVRSTTGLEAPDSDSAFVVKSRSHGEYVFDAGTQMDKELWIDIIKKYTSLCPKSSTLSSSRSQVNGGGHIPGSLSLGAICDSNSSLRSNGRSSTKISRSRSQTPIPRATSPLVESHRVPSMSNSQPTESGSSPFVRNCKERRQIGLDGSIPSLPQPTSKETSPPSLSHSHDSAESTEHTSAISTHNGSPPNVTSIMGTMDSESTASIRSQSLPNKRKTSAPAIVTMNLGNREETMFSSNEALGRVGSEERLSFVNFPMVNGTSNGSSNRCHSRQRSYDSNLNHTTDAGNRFTINVGSQERLSNNGNSAPSSAFSSAGNLHDVRVTSPVSTTPERMARYETSSQTSSINPVYIETNGQQDQQLSAYTDQSIGTNNWASTQIDVQNLRFLAQYPWFHGMISRNVASHLVLETGNRGSGQYLVRQSESREGDFVLTYNCQNRSKHLRLTIDQSGCNIQHLWFEDVLTMLEYFKTHPIPLDSMPATDDVKLMNYIDRSASDNFRSTTVVNIERIQRNNTPRRHHSMHVASTRGIDGGAPSLSQGSNSSTQTPTRNWRQLFSRQTGRSSSSQSVRSHATVQRTQSANAGSLQEIPIRRSRNGSNQRENTYVTRMY